ncbi:hypothetical protein DVR09_14145 [Erythrobacter aureus]|uniref:Uncharacterized protein n=1 Tax=Erythrobacter aureus TaxID=2182384 RepID=A0A345YH99_9SPHN|nr:hypothetical protein DVR09_14145 [Erythrobacter aureus]
MGARRKVAETRKNGTTALTVTYGLAHFGKSLLWVTSSLAFAFFLTEIVGVAPSQMGWAIGLSLLVNAALDLMIGRGLQSRVRSIYAASVSQLVGSWCAAVAFVAFACSGLMPDAAKLPYSIVTLLLFRIGYSLYDVPQNAFMAFAAKTDAVRTRLAATRYVVAGAAALVVAGAITPIIRAGNAPASALSFAMLCAAVSGVSILCAGSLYGFVRFTGTMRQTRPEGSFSVSEPIPQQSREPKTMTFLFFAALASIFLLNLTSAIFANLESFFVAYILREKAVAAYFLLAISLGQILFQPAWGGSGRVLKWCGSCWCHQWFTDYRDLLFGTSGTSVAFRPWSRHSVTGRIWRSRDDHLEYAGQGERQRARKHYQQIWPVYMCLQDFSGHRCGHRWTCAEFNQLSRWRDRFSATARIHEPCAHRWVNYLDIPCQQGLEAPAIDSANPRLDCPLPPPDTSPEPASIQER